MSTIPLEQELQHSAGSVTSGADREMVMSTGFEIRGGFLFVDGVQVPYVPSPHTAGRIIPRYIVDHDTAGPSLDSAVSWFAAPRDSNKSSAHFVVDLDGSITQCVPCDRVAYHAGKSEWRGHAGLNGCSIGVEMVNPGKLTLAGSVCRGWWGGSYPVEECREVTTKSHGRGWWRPYPAAQTAAVNRLHTALKLAYPEICEVLGHFQISPGRKIDPNPLYEFGPARAAIERVDIQVSEMPQRVDDPKPATVVRKTSRKWRILDWLKGLFGGSAVGTAGFASATDVGAAKTYLDTLSAFIASYGVMLLIIVCVGGYVLSQLVQNYIVEDVEEGRYTPSGEAT